MFLKHDDYMDLSTELHDPDGWKVEALRSIDYPLNLTTLALEPISGLLAVGTAGGLIYVFGGPGVESKLTLPKPVGVKFLQFATLAFKLVCIDIQNQLHVWDLSSYGRPNLITSVRFDETNSLTLSPSHTHAFVAQESGEIRTFDLTCLRKSPYTIPNMWRLHENTLLATGFSEMSNSESGIPVDTVIHPRDLNLLFVAYSGGVILSDLVERNTIHVYELVLPPGAPGGSGYGSPDLLTHRRPPITALAIHPAGHFFVVGYADGSLGFWAVEDEDQPLLVKTLDEMNVDIVDAENLDAHIAENTKEGSDPSYNRESIFKLSWSAFPDSSNPRGGETALTILGGLNMGAATGLTVHWLPPFNPPEQPASDTPGTQTSLHPFMRVAMQESLKPTKTFFYDAHGIVQDYLLVPRQSPHFSGTYDPYAILLLTEYEGDTRVLETYQFPPPEFLTQSQNVGETESATSLNDAQGLVEELASTLRSLHIRDEPQRLKLPVPLLNGGAGLLNGKLLALERESYQKLVSDRVADDLRLRLNGGMAWIDEAKSSQLKLAKYQPHRILIAYHLDLTVQFFDISAQLLVTSNAKPLEHSFPELLHDLIIDLKPVLLDPSVVEVTSPTFVDQARIKSVQFATESLECIVVLETGELVVFRLSSGSRPPYKDAFDRGLVPLQHIQTSHGSKFSPYFMLAPRKGAVTACAISDIGFIAAAYLDRSLLIVDMRGPNVLLRRSQVDNVKGRHGVTLHLGRTESPGQVICMLWTVSSIEKDPQSRIRLVAICDSGASHIYTITHSEKSASWTCEGPITGDAVAHPFPQGSFILDSKTGRQRKADRRRLAASLRPSASDEPRSLLVTAGAKSVRCIGNINGEKISKTDWGSKAGTVHGVSIVEQLGAQVLVATTDRHEALVYSLPHLEFLFTLKLPPVTSLPLGVDESGDFIAWTLHPTSNTIHQATYGTLFSIRRVYDLPDIDFLSTKPIVPPQPQPVSLGPTSLFGSWFRFGQSMTGDQLDALLGGPGRPVPEQIQQKPRNAAEGGGTAGMSGLAAATAATQSNLYNRLTSALSDRGQMLGDLEDRFNALEEGSKNMVSQAKRLAAQQTAKGWFGF